MPTETAAPGGYGTREDVRRFAEGVAARQGLDRAWVEAALAQARHQPTVARLIMPAATPSAKNWGAYRARFIDEARLKAGLRWWQDNAEPLRRAQARFGVPAELIVSIVGIETFYGRITGNFRVLDALATLAFDFPTGRSDRSGFFRDELEQFLAFVAADGVEPTAPLGSYAGAMGLPQFMPGSLRRHGVDFDGDGHVTLSRSAADAIGSVANFLVAHGWRPGLPTHFAVQPPEDTGDLAVLIAPDIIPTFDAATFAAHGARLDDTGRRHAGRLALVRLENGGAAPSYVAGTENFFVITRYNWSSYYALAVIEFAALLRERSASPG